MDSHSEHTLTLIAQEIFPELEREVGQAMDELRSSENRLKRIPEALLQNGSVGARTKAIVKINEACEDLVYMLKSLHQQYPKR
tara:strand:- start:776 stop:1024 length:249 start_codon:yes stop_codon:yes gene_type:complete